MIEAPRRWTAFLITLIASLLVVGLLFVDASALPEPIATHWGPGGIADGAMAKQRFVSPIIVLLLSLGAVSSLPTNPLWRVLLLGLAAGFGAMFIGVAWSVRTLNHGATHWTEARNMPLFHVALVIGAMSLPLVWCLIRYRKFLHDQTPGVVVPGLSLEPEQPAVWSSSARNGWFWLLGIGALPSVGFVKDAPSHVFWMVFASIIGTCLLADAFSLLRVRIDRTGVCITYGRLGIVRQRVALADIAHAETLLLKPMAHGGWGYRGSLLLMKRAAVVVRAGSALRLALKSGRQLTITVDDPTEGAALLNGLIEPP